MKEQPAKAIRIYAAMGAITGWFVIILQFYLLMAHRTLTVTGTTIQFFSYFTILTNILVAVCFTALLLKPESVWRTWFSQQRVLTAIAVYIAVVGIVYNLVLRQLWKPEGWQLIADELLHSVIPVFFVVFWLLFVRKDELQWKDVIPWLIYPLVYLVFVMIRGALSGLYPYPFIDAKTLGYASVFLNGLILVTGFLLFSLLLVAMGKITARASR